MKIFYFNLLSCFLLLAGSLNSNAQTSADPIEVIENPVVDTNKIVVNSNYAGLFYLDYVFVETSGFPSWTSSQNSMTFEEYVILIKNWIIANPSLYAQLISNRASYTRITSETSMTFDGDRASRVKESTNTFGPLILMQKKINENFPSVSEVQSQISVVPYYTGLIHIDDLHFFQ